MINTGTTVVTFLMVFLIENPQVKLEELIRAIEGAHNALLDLEELEDEELDKIRATYQALGRVAREDLLCGRLDTGAPTWGFAKTRLGFSRRMIVVSS